MGAFASMAQNSYGLLILGVVAITFALLFLIQFLESLRKKDPGNIYLPVELGCLFVFSSIFGLRIFYIHFKYVEFVFAFMALVLVVLYCRKAFIYFRAMAPKNKFLSISILAFYGSIILFLLSMIFLSISPLATKYLGALAFILLIFFITANFFKKDILVDGENLTPFRMVGRMRDNSLLIISLFFLFSLYSILTITRILPKIYSDEFPQAYFNLVDSAELRKESASGGHYKYEDFKEKYDQFLRLNGIK